MAVLKLSTTNLEKIIDKIIIALPERQFHNASPIMSQDILSFIAKNFIFFQAQEDLNSDGYEQNLLSFIGCLSDQIDQRYFPKQPI
ncbi:hypothetical protein [Candidatus Rickettsiella viridis]|uniref:hypothetical protein n=1 Tax=Candidatus Rickettsiella viridis TaxID=676208 RepID=UPI000F824567|nr:hypothetical protein [Candidatus Rickettsiella viridis]